MPDSTPGWDYARALRELWDRSSYERGYITDPFGDATRAERGLQRMRGLLDLLGTPQLRVPSVHVAGSKGKGSTASFIAAAAGAAGLRVGLYTSPHLHRFPERISIGGQPISDNEFAETARVVASAAQRLEAEQPALGTVSTFDLITAMAFVAFLEASDLSVIEVGLGGRYDSTNVLNPLVAVITRIDFEHTAVLGNTLTEIARQKAGILRPGVPCVSSPQLPEAAQSLEQAAVAVHAPFFLGGRDWTWQGTWRDFSATGPWGTWAGLATDVAGPHQLENATTALAAIHHLNLAGLNIPEAAVRAGLAHAGWPGRFERHVYSGRDVIFDGAHTPAAAAALVETWRAEVGTANATVILGMGADKNPSAFLAALRPIVSSVIATRADSPRAAEPEALADAARALGLPTVVAPTVATAIDRAITKGPDPLLITGSLFVAGEGREALGLAAPDAVWARLNRERIPRTDAPIAT